MTDADAPLSVAELVEYCRTQAGLLAGKTETIGEETDALLDEIDEDIATVRERLETQRDAASDEADLGALGELESDLEEKQAVAEAKRARMVAFQELSEAYAELAADLDANVDDGQAALERVVRFERDHDAPAYFDERQTLLEAVAESS